MSKDLNNYTGNQYNMLTVISMGHMAHVGPSKQKRHIVPVKCKCGTEKFVQIKHLKEGSVASCGCTRRKKLPSVGSTNGILTVIDNYSFNKRRNGYALIKVQCECGVIKDIIGSNFKTAKHCGCLIGKRVNMKHKGYTIYSSFVKNARHRDIEFTLNIDEFIKLIDSPCYYCGTINNKNKFKYGTNKDKIYMYSGIDRIDSSIGYILDNCVACCKHCNYYKAELTIEQFKENIKRLYSNIDNF